MSGPAMTVPQLDAARREQKRLADGKLVELNLVELLTQPAPGNDWLWDGMFERGTVVQLHGAGGVGKSIAVAGLVRAAASGNAFLGRDTYKARVVMIDGENPTPEIHRRLQRFGFADVADRISYFQADEAIFIDLAKAEETLLLLAGNMVDLIVIDSQRALWYGDENATEAVRPFYAMLRRVANATAAAILVLHHDAKHGGYSGSSDLNASVDCRLHLVREDDGALTLHHEKLRSGPEQPPMTYRLHVVDGLFAFELERSRTREGDVFDAVTDLWQTVPEIATAAGVRRDDTKAILFRLTRSNVVERALGPEGRNSRAECYRLPARAGDESGRPPDGNSASQFQLGNAPVLVGSASVGSGRVSVRAPKGPHTPPATTPARWDDDVRNPE